MAMDLNTLMASVKQHPDFGKVGMVLCHNGVVRQTTREGKEVTGLQVEVDHAKLQEIIASQKATPGIVEVLVEINGGKPLKVGDDVMFIIVAGDIRETVIKTLTDTLNRVKSEVTSKTQFFK